MKVVYSDRPWLELTSDAIFRFFNDKTLAFVSVVVTTSAIFFHTKSAWLTLIGSLQILFAAPLAYCVYFFFGGLKL